MRKSSTQKSAPLSLGTKRSCPKCGTKFYDFAKSDLNCPKCRYKFSPQDLETNRLFIEPRKKAEKQVPKVADDEETATKSSGDGFESLEDLTDDDADGVDEVEVDEDEDEDQKY